MFVTEDVMPFIPSLAPTPGERLIQFLAGWGRATRSEDHMTLQRRYHAPLDLHAFAAVEELRLSIDAWREESAPIEPYPYWVQHIRADWALRDIRDYANWDDLPF